MKIINDPNRSNADKSSAYNTLAVEAWGRRKDYKKSLHYHDLAVELSPGDARHLALRARLHGRASKDILAMRDFDHALKLGRGLGRGLTYHMRGKYFLDKKKYNRAIEDLTAAINTMNAVKPTFSVVLVLRTRAAVFELLNETLFRSLWQARRLIAEWQTRYNEERTHTSLGGLTPNEFATRSTKDHKQNRLCL